MYFFIFHWLDVVVGRPFGLTRFHMHTIVFWDAKRVSGIVEKACASNLPTGSRVSRKLKGKNNLATSSFKKAAAGLWGCGR